MGGLQSQLGEAQMELGGPQSHLVGLGASWEGLEARWEGLGASQVAGGGERDGEKRKITELSAYGDTIGHCCLRGRCQKKGAKKIL